MQTADFDIDQKQEETCTVRFRRDIHVVTTLDGEILSSDEADWVTIHIPGDPLNVIDTVVTDEHKARFPRAWAEYQGMREGNSIGVPLEQWDIHPNMIKVFRDLGFSTIEQVAHASEHSLMRIQGGWGWKSKAKMWLEEKKPKVADEIAAIKEENAKIMEDNAKLRSMVEQLLAKKAG